MTVLASRTITVTCAVGGAYLIVSGELLMIGSEPLYLGSV